jgi:peptidyl-Lys metalloendopeptidase
MNLCNGFWRAAGTGIDSRPGVIVHEMTHIAAGTGDRDREGRFVYGPTSVQRLATKGDGAAVMVADAHEYFLETLPGNAPGV